MEIHITFDECFKCSFIDRKSNSKLKRVNDNYESIIANSLRCALKRMILENKARSD